MDNLSLILTAGEALHRTLDIERRVFIILTCATAGCAFGFSRAFLLLYNEKMRVLEVSMGVGPVSQEDAERIWFQMSREDKPLEELLLEYDKIGEKRHLPLYSLVERLNAILVNEGRLAAECMTRKESFIVHRSAHELLVSDEFLHVLGTEEFVCVPLLIDDGTVVGALLADNLYSHRPITEESVQSLVLFADYMGVAIEEARLHQRLVENQEKLIEMERAMRQSYVFASLGEANAYLAHEIRNPLTIIGGFARSIHRHMHEPEVLEKLVNTVIREVERLEALLNETLDFARFREPLFQLRDVNRIIEEICELMELELNKRGLGLLKDLGPVPLLRIDEDQLKQVFFNLIQNAMESMSRGGTLHISTRKCENFVQIDISDTGIGFGPEIGDKVFTPFFTTKTRGTGLGLSVSRLVIELHGGRLKIASEKSRGTVVSIVLPVPPD